MTGTQPTHIPAEIDIVVAAYNRGRVLSRALRTVIAQTERNWRALVIGDGCTDDTESRIAALGDHRIKFINLPERFGEQAGPNSVGMGLADADYVAFLNQDDYWFPNHLALAVRELERSEADIYWSRAAFFTNRGAWEDRVFFCDVSPCGRRFEDMYDCNYRLAEPMSAWVAPRSTLNRLGPMKLASQTAQMPIVEYCQRAFRTGMRLEAGTEITVLKDRVWHPPPGYGNQAHYAETWVRQIESGDTDRLRQTIDDELWLADALGMTRIGLPAMRSFRQGAKAHIDRHCGLNLTEIGAAARTRSPLLLNRVLRNRTGATVRQQPPLEDMVTYARGVMQ
ncbi:glycosyltransferase family 2 protein [Tropicimonas sediminicola]|uniref:Glycosyl transferase family 2 n=1 Tax=Tropicimonas sediminicola TaxID=1031541 RepID=A0A239MHN4_9RHOB|nr:glycosyltransferase family A protein [Tropicimonas sediminicola]SNT41309.1 Glycosyl transferase family 2 [Tropicimonas sediminicola]